MILGWFENYMPHEIPPEHMWEDDAGIEKWFKIVQENKDNEYNTGNDVDGNPLMISNDLAETFKNL